MASKKKKKGKRRAAPRGLPRVPTFGSRSGKRGRRTASKSKPRAAGGYTAWAASKRRQHPGVSQKQLANWWAAKQRFDSKAFAKYRRNPPGIGAREDARSAAYAAAQRPGYEPRVAGTRRRRASVRRAVVHLPGGSKPARRRTARGPAHYSAVTATFGTGRGAQKHRTYLYRTGKGRLKHIPYYATLGFASARALKRALDSSSGVLSDTQRALLVKRMEHLFGVRAKGSAAEARRVSTGRSPFYPNRGTMKKKSRRKSAKGRRRDAKGHFLPKRSSGRRRMRRNGRKAPTWHKRALKQIKAGKPRRAGKRRRTFKQRLSGAVTAKAAIARYLTTFGQRVRGIKFNDNRRRRRGFRRHGFRRNGPFMGQFKAALKLGAFTFGGYAAHRFLSKLLTDSVFGRLDFMQSPTVAPYTSIISGLVTAALGVFGVTKISAIAQHAAPISAGMVVSLLQDVVFGVAGRLGEPGGKVAAALSAYPDAPGYASSLGAYYTFGAHQQYPDAMRAGVGEYLQAGNTGLQQQAAGFGSFPLLQAAAGVGEYEVVPGYSGFGMVDEGVAPNLYAAEQALNVAEAAAGFGDLTSVNISDPAMQVVQVPDEPGGSRSGTLAGQNGIFG